MDASFYLLKTSKFIKLKAKAAPKQEHQNNKVYVIKLEANTCIGVSFLFMLMV